MDSHGEIQRIAYLLWLDNKCPDGRDLEFWLQAEEIYYAHEEWRISRIALAEYASAIARNALIKEEDEKLFADLQKEIDEAPLTCSRWKRVWNWVKRLRRATSKNQ